MVWLGSYLKASLGPDARLVPLGIWLRGTGKELRNLSSGFSFTVMGLIKEFCCTWLLLFTSRVVSL